MSIRIRPYTQVELIAAAAKNNGCIVAVLSVPLSVLIDMGDQKTREHDPEYIECYVHRKLIPDSKSYDEGYTCMGNTEYMVVGHVPGNGNDDSSAPEGEVLIQFTGDVSEIVREIKADLARELCELENLFSSLGKNGMKPADHMEVLIEADRHVKIEGSPRDLLTVVNALKENGHNPQIRFIDSETKEWTHWQPTHN